MIGYWLIVCHLVGDYLLQSDWMAMEKTKNVWAAFCHAATYTLPFAVLIAIHTGTAWPFENFTEGPVLAIMIIMWSHFAIDHWRLARHVCWIKNFMSPLTYVPDPCGPNEKCGGCTENGCTAKKPLWWHPWKVCSGTGYHKDKPAWMAVWLMIITDNTMHLAINGLAWGLL